MEEDSSNDGEVNDHDELNLSLSQKFKHKLLNSSREDIVRSLSTPVTDISPPHSPSPSPPQAQRIPVAAPIINKSSSTIHCLSCSTPRLVNQNYCTSCGWKLPPLPQMDDKPTRLSTCPSCRAEFTPDISQCHVCESHLIPPHPLPKQPPNNNDTMVPCLYCGVLNDSSMNICVGCDQQLIKRNQSIMSPVDHDNDRDSLSVMHPIIGSSYLMCGICGRINVSDARFCDWCGNRPSKCDVKLKCISCDTINQWISKYCHNCGQVIKCPLRPNVEDGDTSLKMFQRISNDDCHKWIPVADITTHTEDKMVHVKSETHSRGTQTHGLFYPSDRTITINKQQEKWKNLVKKVSRDRALNLSTHSPGKGLWRSQLEHIIDHLRAYSSSSLPFQESISHQQLGNLTSGSVETTTNSNELMVKLSFRLKNQSDDTMNECYHQIKK
jgi:hypothetical protein